MNQLNCEYVREVYPDVLNGHAAAETAATVRTHLASCADCREATALLARIHAAPVTVPPQLHERVLAARAAERSWPRLRHYAMAATVAAAAIGGSLLFTMDRTRPLETNAPVGLGFLTVEDAMLSGTASLQDLTVEELEQLLGEMES